MDGFESAFDGMIQLSSAGNPRALLQETVATSFVSQVTLAAAIGGGIDSSLKDIIISKAKLSNKITEDLIKKYHSSFMNLYKRAQDHIKRLEQDIAYYKDPLRETVTTASFVPENASIKKEFIEYVIEANARGVTLKEVLPPELLAKYGMATG